MGEGTPQPSDEQIAAVRDNDLVTNYEPHDVAQDWLIESLERRGWNVDEYGTDDRHGDVKFGNGPDLVVYPLDTNTTESTFPLTPCGYVEVKSKRFDKISDGWYGRCNERHWDEYVEHDESHPVPTFVYMTAVDEGQGMVVRDGFWEVSETTVETLFRSKGNLVVEMDATKERNLAYVCSSFVENAEEL